MKSRLLAVLFALASSVSMAKDLGVQGNTWPITEIDMRRLMVESASRVDWVARNKEIIERSKHYLTNLPRRQFPGVDATQTYYADVSLTLTSDIQAPVQQADGSYQWEVLAKKGTRINPLSHEEARPVTAFFLFDGSQPEQIELLKKLMAAEPYRIVPIEAGAGDLAKTSDLFKRPIFYANDELLNRAQIKYLPSLVYPGEGRYYDYLAITAFAKPFKPEDVLNVWSVLRPKSPQPPSKKVAKKQ